MKPEDRSKLRSLNSAFGKPSDELCRFKRIRFFDFTSHGRNKDAAVSESERREYIRAQHSTVGKRLLSRKA